MTESPSASNQDIKRRVASGLRWIGTASAIVVVLDLIGTFTILRYWLSDAEYGRYTKAWWLFAILDLGTDLMPAVVQRAKVDEGRVSALFWISLAWSSVVFGAILLAHPLLAWTFSSSVVATVLAVYATKLLWQNVFQVPYALMRRDLRYGEISAVRVAANVAELGAKMSAAAMGYGVWALVIGSLSRLFVFGVGVQICQPWWPRVRPVFVGLRADIAFAAKASGSQILYAFYTNVDYPIVGAVFGEAALGVYRIGYELVLEPVKIMSDVSRDLAFSAYSRLRAQGHALGDQFLSLARLNLVVVLPYAALMLVVNTEILALFFKPEYGAAHRVILPLAMVAVLRAGSFVMTPVLDGAGVPGRALRYQIVAGVLMPTLFVVASRVFSDLGILSVGIAWAIGYPAAFAVLFYMVRHTIKLTTARYLQAVRGVVACVAVAGVVGLGVRYAALGLPTAVRLILVTVTILGLSAYLLGRFQGITRAAFRRSLKS